MDGAQTILRVFSRQAEDCIRLLTVSGVQTCALPSVSEYRFFFFQAEDGIRYLTVTGVQTCALPISVVPCAGAPIDDSRDQGLFGRQQRRLPRLRQRAGASLPGAFPRRPGDDGPRPLDRKSVV